MLKIVYHYGLCLFQILRVHPNVTFFAQLNLHKSSVDCYRTNLCYSDYSDPYNISQDLQDRILEVLVGTGSLQNIKILQPLMKYFFTLPFRKQEYLNNLKKLVCTNYKVFLHSIRVFRHSLHKKKRFLKKEPRESVHYTIIYVLLNRRMYFFLLQIGLCIVKRPYETCRRAYTVNVSKTMNLIRQE